MRRSVGAVVVLVVTMAGLTGCAASGSNGQTAATNSPAPSVGVSSAAATPSVAGSPGTASGSTVSAAAVTITNFAYRVSGPVTAGQKVTVQNSDDVAHTVTADTGNAFDVNVPAHGTATFTAPSTPGRYPFHCTYHSNMHATIVVR